MQNESLKLLKLTLSNELYNRYKDILLDTMFPSPVDTLWSLIKDAHKRYGRDITCPELLALYNANDGVVTEARRGAMESLLQDLDTLPIIGNDIAIEVIRVAYKREAGRSLIENAYCLIDDRSEFDFEQARKLILQVEAGCIPDTNHDDEFVTTEVEDLLTEFDLKDRWKFNLDGLQKSTNGIGKGEFACIFARPETGKDASFISWSAGPGGWCEQGANVHILANEERPTRTMLRAVSACTGMTAEQIKEDPKAAIVEFAKIKNNIKMIDCIGWSMKEVAAYCRKYSPDILIINQLDKITDTSHGDVPSHERLRCIYTDARELAKVNSLALFGVSQAGFEAEGKGVVHFSHLEGSRTGKAAELDLAIGIGCNGVEQQTGGYDNNRCITLSKNKLTGIHNSIFCKIQPQLSRYVH